MATVGDFELLRGSSTPLLATGDILRFVDVSDPTQAAQGSLVSATVANYFAAIPTPIVVTSASAAALAVGLTGATNPAFAVDASTALQVAGLKVTGAVTGGTVAIVTTDSGAATNLTINAKGTGTIGIGSVSTGLVTITPATRISGVAAIGGATNVSIGLNVVSAALTGTTQIGIVAQHVSSSTATTRSTALTAVGGNAAGVYVVTSASQLFLDDWQKGAGSTITTQYGLFVNSQTQGATNYAILTNLGLVSFGDAVACSSTLNVVGNFSVNTNKLTVNATTGAVVFAGALSGISTLAGTGAVSGFTSGTFSAGLVATGLTAAGANADLSLSAVGAGGQVLLKTTFGTVLTASNTGTVSTASTISTAAPTGGSGAWLLGIANAVSPTSPNRTVTISIGGTLYYLAAKTTND
jgi:hypothetical protein